MKGYLLDTHYWIWFQLWEKSELSATAVSQLERWQMEGELFVSDISVLELARLTQSGRVSLQQSLEEFVAEALEDGGLRFLALTRKLLLASTRLPGTIHRDPDDRLIAATAREHGLTLVTRDRALLEYGKAGHVNARKI